MRRPTLELVAGDDSRVRALAAADCALEPCSQQGGVRRAGDGRGRRLLPGRRLGPASSAWRRPTSKPRGARSAGSSTRRPTRASPAPRRTSPATPASPLRALLSRQRERAVGTQPAVAVLSERLDLLDLDPLESAGGDDPASACTGMGEHFLSVQSDRETAFRRPPLSTKQMLSPRLYRAGEQPVVLAGAPPAQAGCTVESDESVGLARLLNAAFAKSRSVRGPVVASWEGDRAVRFACDDDGVRWVYVVSVADPTKAAAFAAAAPDLLPGELAGPADVAVAGGASCSRAGSARKRRARGPPSLTSEPLTGLPGLD